MTALVAASNVLVWVAIGAIVIVAIVLATNRRL